MQPADELEMESLPGTLPYTVVIDPDGYQYVQYVDARDPHHAKDIALANLGVAPVNDGWCAAVFAGHQIDLLAPRRQG